MIDRLIVENALKSQIHDDWLYNSILQFLCGDGSVNILENKKVLQHLNTALLRMDLLDEIGFEGTRRVTSLGSIGMDRIDQDSEIDSRVLDMARSSSSGTALSAYVDIDCLKYNISNSTSSISISVHSANNKTHKDKSKRIILEYYAKYFNYKMEKAMKQMGEKSWSDIRELMNIYLGSEHRSRVWKHLEFWERLKGSQS